MSATTIPMDASASTPADSRPAPVLRLWPGIVLLAVLWAARISVGFGEQTPTKFFFGLVITPFVVNLLLLVWWLFASRLRTPDRIMVVAAYVLGIASTIVIAGDNFPIMALVFYGMPTLATGWVAWLLVSIPLKWPLRRTGLVALLILICVFFQLQRVDGMDGSFNATFNWRWTPTPEQQMLAELAAKPKTPAPPASATPAAPTTPATTDAVLTAAPGDWPAFRGPDRDGRLQHVKIDTDWAKSPPKKLWSRRVGPGWSSFAVIGRFLFTQEQRDANELVVCYDAETGTEVWSHAEATRFSEMIGGPGPRGTPTFDAGRIYALGANGVLLCLDAAKGTQIWKANIIADSGATVPVWGFSSSPLVAHGIVSVYAGGPGKAVLGYKAANGELAWSGGEGKMSYCSPQLVKLAGVEQILFNTDIGTYSFDPEKGTVLWEYKWNTNGAARVVQPAVIGDNDVLIGTGMVLGTRRLNLTHDNATWTPKDVWTSKPFKPYYNDFVVYKDNIYGFGDGGSLVCVDLAEGKQLWKAPGYGNGQMVLLEEQGLLFVVTEKGEIALVEANPAAHKEIARTKAIEGKTWNHPVLAHGKLYVRNGEQMAAFDLAGWEDVAAPKK